MKTDIKKVKEYTQKTASKYYFFTPSDEGADVWDGMHARNELIAPTALHKNWHYAVVDGERVVSVLQVCSKCAEPFEEKEGSHLGNCLDCLS